MGFLEIAILELAVIEATVGLVCEHALLEKCVEPLIPVMGMAAKVAFDTAVETSVELMTEKAIVGLFDWGEQILTPILSESDN
jgi:hypothetical protein